MHSISASALAAALISGSYLLGVGAQGTTCNSTSPCEFGFCGTDNFCLGGCNPLASHDLTSCRPNPICQDATHTFADNSRILSNGTFFDGNATEYDWVVDKGNIMNTNSSGGELAMLLTETNGGTRLSSTRYIHYGKVTATMKTGKWGGVVTAFITMSDIKDEIDWEFPGAATTEGQTNFFWQGVIPQQTHGDTSKDLTDTFQNYHDYTIDWQPDSLTFSIDNNVVRTVKASDFQSNGANQFPNTPSRIQLSLWPAGIDSMPSGTVEWAGGMINWDDSDYQSAGHFYALVKQITIQCNDQQSANGTTKQSDTTGYVYGSNSTSEQPSVAFTNSSTLINGAVSMRGVEVTGLKVVGMVVTALVGMAFAL
ncbi:glycoside hydrolase family 16 protein [Dendrothele bispora CBS 962.96]|uniref:Glycoside hydrolase family 16 protein n=1 Tax=Dendrothele bispora (strain CBS 962.96) TaxID=1314807 RepID=A0A4V4HDL7_DENBC|nr:glycoside hydrolase family 16 protein [Dendrothele bispora CBS 962.96]